jgi:hypothetical protein
MKKITIAVIAGAVMLAVPAIASAEVSLSKAQVLRHQICYSTGTTFTGWTAAEGDSPLDTNSKAYVFDVAPGGCGLLYSRKASVTGLNTTVGNVHNLSFDFKESAHLGAGAPRISVQFANGDIGYLAASYCNQPLAVSGGTWGRADFTGSTLSNSAPCELQVTGTTGGNYDSTTTQSAWDVYAAAHPSQVVSTTYLVGDEEGHYVIDRLTLGAGFMYDKSNTVGVSCQQDETRC